MERLKIYGPSVVLIKLSNFWRRRRIERYGSFQKDQLFGGFSEFTYGFVSSNCTLMHVFFLRAAPLSCTGQLLSALRAGRAAEHSQICHPFFFLH